ncbi:MAG: rhomboid family intramembrane serine protease [Candidatus Aenigmarchaeota archaeon]|nr:rhomboid family intramembrane serine protease [Candidatus Aenigmarchaeota archaeon]
MRLTLLLSALIVIVFVLVVLFVDNIDEFYSFYGFSDQNMLERPYVFFTSIFLHAGIEHLLANLFVLVFFGLAVEKELGSARTLAIFLLGAVAGDMLSLAVYPFDALSVGASAGIFALIGVGMLVRPLDLSFYPLILPIPLLFLGIAYTVYNIYGFFFLPESNISYIGHFGGLFVGLVLGFAETGFRKGLKTLLIGIAGLVIIAALWWYFVSRAL